MPAADDEFLSPTMRIIQDYLTYFLYCGASALFTLCATIVYYLMARRKRDRQGEDTRGRQRNANQEGNKDEMNDKNKGDMEDGRKESDAMDTDKTDSYGHEGSEEDLPWLLKKAPSETTLSDGKNGWSNDEKQSEATDSDKSQDVTRSKPKFVCGDVQRAGISNTPAEDY